MRHPSADSAHIAASLSPVPIINGGNGSMEHPTQAFLDLFTIREELGTVNGLTVTFVGDLKYGRTVHSLVRLLLHYHVNVNLVSPSQLALPDEVKADLEGKIEFREYSELNAEVVAQSDVLYCTRVQGERFESAEEYERLKSCFVVDNKVLRVAKKGMIVMHPLPRNQEISDEVDFDQVFIDFQACLTILESRLFPSNEVWTIREDGLTCCCHRTFHGSYLEILFRAETEKTMR
jgi:carbamoyl-phosphate synthase/aspartate carbamoyltransferase